MSLPPHKVLAPFIHAGARVEPPGPWSPPSQSVADKLVKAGCLKATPDKAVAEPQPAPEKSILGQVRAAVLGGSAPPPVAIDEAEETPSEDEATPKRGRRRRGG